MNPELKLPQGLKESNDEFRLEVDMTSRNDGKTLMVLDQCFRFY